VKNEMMQDRALENMVMMGPIGAGKFLKIQVTASCSRNTHISWN